MDFNRKILNPKLQLNECESDLTQEVAQIIFSIFVITIYKISQKAKELRSLERRRHGWLDLNAIIK